VLLFGNYSESVDEPLVVTVRFCCWNQLIMLVAGWKHFVNKTAVYLNVVLEVFEVLVSPVETHFVWSVILVCAT